MKDEHLNILVLDGGGSKSVYTLGVLKELELKLGEPIYKHFGLIYGTSTGSINGEVVYTPPCCEDVIREKLSA